MGEDRHIAVAGTWPDAFVGVVFVMIFSSSLFAEVRSFIKVGGKDVCRAGQRSRRCLPPKAKMQQGFTVVQRAQVRGTLPQCTHGASVAGQRQYGGRHAWKNTCVLGQTVLRVAARISPSTATLHCYCCLSIQLAHENG